MERIINYIENSFEDVTLPSIIFSNDHNLVDTLTHIPEENYYLIYNGKILKNGINDLKCMKNAIVQINYRLRGGKGGFGALLKAFRISKSSNQRDSRDLSGRRISDIEEEKRILKWIEGQSKRELEAAKKKLAKYIKCKNSLDGVSKHKITNDKYLKVKALIDSELSRALEETNNIDEEKSSDDICDNKEKEEITISEDENEKNLEKESDNDSDCDFSDLNAGPNTFGKSKKKKSS
ncbi:Protein SDE2 homolog [Strongyloides ratti]|uniref:Protein SDE2 homolog n=1 Tax=Strongyloides ratti TaxID=34506 RepID=A0A090KYK4_STRRB|nr:Protein SDE2 homolog [Strongyloides ratti]CEF62521.1 Protein SDE2 homolog [Strongyloides ratti]